MPSRRGASGAQPPQNLHDEDEELDLPPLDGALDDDDEPSRAGDDEDAIEEGESAIGDERAAIDVDADVVLDVTDEPAIEGSEAAKDAIDVGAFADEIAIDEGAPRALDESGPARDEEDDSPFDAAGIADEGAGTADDPSSFVDEAALPPLDADGGEGEGLDAIEPHVAEEAPIALAPRRWRAVSGVGAQVPCWLVATSPALVVAAGPTVVIARDGGRVSKAAGPEIDVVALAAAEEAIFAVARKGTLFASVDGGDTWATGSVPWTAVRGALAIAATPGRLWICEGGALWSVRWSRRSRTEPPVQARREGVRAMIAAGSTLVILTERSDPEGPESAADRPRSSSLTLERLRGDDEAPDASPLPGSAREAIGEGPVTLATTDDGRSLAIFAAGTIHVSRDGGSSFRRCKLPSAIAIAFAGAGPSAPLMALTRADDRSKGEDLALVEVIDSSPARVADLPGAGAASGRAAIAWDPSREVLWVASSNGLVAYEPSAQH